MIGGRLTVYVAYHEEAKAPLPSSPPYVAVCNVRADGTRPEGFTAYDDDGGLPHRNTAYNELSVLHRLQQRADTPMVALAHYRRALVARRPQGRRGELPGTVHVRDGDWQRPHSWGADESALLRAVRDLDWVTPLPFDVRRAGYRSLWEHFAVNHPGDLLTRADEVCRALHPELEPLESYLRRSTRTPLFNIFLGRREVLDRYAEFLWPVLAACQPRVPVLGYQGRWAGFLAERLHGYWLAAVARPTGCRTGVLPLGLLDVPVPPWRRRAAASLPPRVVLDLTRLSRGSAARSAVRAPGPGSVNP